MKTFRRLLLTTILFFFCADTLLACEPILPLARAFGGPGYVAGSLVWLGIAVLIKVVAFIFLERSLLWYRAAIFMVLGNVLSSIIGFFVAASAANPPVLLFSLPLVYVLSIVPSRRLVKFTHWKLPPSQLALACPAAIFVTWVLFGLATGQQDADHLAAYWLLKLTYATVAVSISMLLTSLWEEWIVALLARRTHGNRSFITTVGRANYVTFFVIFLGAAVKTLPQRFHSHGFLVRLDELVRFVVG